MARPDPLSRIRTAARRSAGDVAVETQRNWYQDDLKRDLGLDADSNKARELAIAKLQRRANRPRYGLILFIGLFAFFLFMAVRLWSDGVLAMPVKLVPLPSKDWMKSRDLPALSLPGAPENTATKSDAPPNFFEPDQSPAPVKEEEASDPETATDEG